MAGRKGLRDRTRGSNEPEWSRSAREGLTKLTGCQECRPEWRIRTFHAGCVFQRGKVVEDQQVDGHESPQVRVLSFQSQPPGAAVRRTGSPDGGSAGRGQPGRAAWPVGATPPCSSIRFKQWTSSMSASSTATVHVRSTRSPPAARNAVPAIATWPSTGWMEREQDLADLLVAALSRGAEAKGERS